MVVRVALVLFFLALCLCMAPADKGTAGPPAACPPTAYGPPACGPAMPPCGPPRFGPPNPLTACGAMLNSCTNVCGICLTLPSALMRGLLAPPRCGPGPFGWRRGGYAAPVAYPAYAPPPPYAAPPAPRRISKCRPAAPAPVCQPAYMPPAPVACRPMAGPRCGPPPMPGCFALCTQLLAIPARLVSGALFSEPPYATPFADGALGSTFGQYW